MENNLDIWREGLICSPVVDLILLKARTVLIIVTHKVPAPKMKTNEQLIEEGF